MQPPPTQIVHEKPIADAPPSEQLKYLMQQMDVQKQEIELLKDQNEYQASQIEVVNWDIKDIHKKFNMREVMTEYEAAVYKTQHPQQAEFSAVLSKIEKHMGSVNLGGLHDAVMANTFSAHQQTAAPPATAAAPPTVVTALPTVNRATSWAGIAAQGN